jgi:hypothetical protein
MQHKRWPWEKHALEDIFRLVPEMEVWCSKYLFYWPGSGAVMGDKLHSNCNIMARVWGA